MSNKPLKHNKATMDIQVTILKIINPFDMILKIVSNPIRKNEFCRIDQDKVFAFPEISQIFNQSRRQLAYFRQKMQVLSQIFYKLRLLFIFDHRSFLFQIRIYFKDNQAESFMLENYTEAIHNNANKLKLTLFCNIKSKNESNARNHQKLHNFSDPSSRNMLYLQQKSSVQKHLPTTQEKNSQNLPVKQSISNFEKEGIQLFENTLSPPSSKAYLQMKNQKELIHPKQQLLDVL